MDESELTYSKRHKCNRLNCCDWKAVTEIPGEPLLVTINQNVYILSNKKITFEEFYKFTQDHKYKVARLAAEIVGVTMPCGRCGGSGKTDWVEKVMNKNRNKIPFPHKRDPYGRVLKFSVPITINPHITERTFQYGTESPFYLGYITDYLKRGITHHFIYTSLPHLKISEELCPACYGSGLKIIAHEETKLITSKR
jgi:hypothetical protein